MKGSGAKSFRWFSDYDAADRVTAHRHCRMLLVDLVVISHGVAPFNARADFYDTVADVFQNTGQSMVAASAILRDEYMFKVSSRLLGGCRTMVGVAGAGHVKGCCFHGPRDRAFMLSAACS